MTEGDVAGNVENLSDFKTKLKKPWVLDKWWKKTIYVYGWYHTIVFLATILVLLVASGYAEETEGFEKIEIPCCAEPPEMEIIQKEVIIEPVSGKTIFINSES